MEVLLYVKSILKVTDKSEGKPSKAARELLEVFSKNENHT